MKFRGLASLTAGIAGAMCIVTQPVHAQRLVHLVLGGGVSIPVAKFHETYGRGGQFMTGIVFGAEEGFLGGRFTYSSNVFRGRSILGKEYRDTKLGVVTADVIGTVPLGTVKPYGIIGGGWYPYREATDSKRENNLGASIGAGVAFPVFGAASFVEGRYHSVAKRTTAKQFVTATFGILL